MQENIISEIYANRLDEKDQLGKYKSEFFIPQHNGKDCIYLTGNSLGLQPKKVRAAIEQELGDWAEFGVEGHTDARIPWLYYHHDLSGLASSLVGAYADEVVVMNNLTVNLHLMMVSFYQPNAKRFKIMIEGGAFPSDQYAVDSQARFHGFDPADAVIELRPRAGEHTLRTEDILNAISEAGSSLALVMLGGVNYYTGQWYDMRSITEAAHEVGAYCGFDLAHAAGNVPVKLHDWGCDFAVWCSYKYLNSGPGGTSGVFVHRKHANNKTLPRFAGWWGHNEKDRFLMQRAFDPMPGAQGWQLSNAQIFPMAIHRVALQLFEEAGFENLRQKSIALTTYLEQVLTEVSQNSKWEFELITPKNPAERGCQLSVLVKENGKALYQWLKENGVVVDWREPNVIRMAPVPLYNSFTDVYKLGKLMLNSKKMS